MPTPLVFYFYELAPDEFQWRDIPEGPPFAGSPQNFRAHLALGIERTSSIYQGLSTTGLTYPNSRRQNLQS